jgi:hypothetical protein
MTGEVQIREPIELGLVPGIARLESLPAHRHVEVEAERRGVGKIAALGTADTRRGIDSAGQAENVVVPDEALGGKKLQPVTQEGRGLLERRQSARDDRGEAQGAAQSRASAITRAASSLCAGSKGRARCL